MTNGAVSRPIKVVESRLIPFLYGRFTMFFFNEALTISYIYLSHLIS